MISRPDAAAVTPEDRNKGDELEMIVVTAQKREQNLQDVPVAVTALSENTLVANRIATVSDLSGMAPGVTVRTAAGGSQLPSFAVRGAISYGVVPGSLERRPTAPIAGSPPDVRTATSAMSRS